ncbi:polysaccharide biosynthesis protein [Azospirillum lipoferum]|uniref:Nucleoside-diphosphate sugar epimerase n=1 Tax=Azospirillum lipoferum (strain 4B) TaxID=862719 RepID=G7ZIN1_AZOL4|nr:polysaccharide biosynthesis protein [Azospirillum lipoferum]CBS91506.1 Putative nucleoside-diphosphate sugar epimerase [Azospirillum lipoferum 4B]
MPEFRPFDPSTLAEVATGRSDSLFAADIARNRLEIEDAVAGRRILVVGGAGSIGSQVVTELAARAPAALHVIDQSENNLVELVRTLRGRPAGLPVADFRTFPIDYGATPTRLFLSEQPPYDAVLNFAALKHVRSEKDPWSLLQMLDTNLVKQARFLSWLRRYGHDRRYFSVSTDKAANPVNLMGASKRVAEHIVFDGAPGQTLAHATSARFANVAFSDGSLLHGFFQRMLKRQPLAVPQETRRYFVSPEEAGHICLLAAFRAPHRTIIVPDLMPETHLRDLSDIAKAFLARFGLKAEFYEDERSACQIVDHDMAVGRYPVLITARDTSGEKPYEEFVGNDETIIDLGFDALRGVSYTSAPPKSVERLLVMLESVLHGGAAFDKAMALERISAVVPHFRHIETGRNLDQRL